MTMPHPHQNININISYSLESQRSGRRVISKHLVNTHKTNCLPNKHQFDISSKLKTKKSTNIAKKSQQIKQITQTHKHHRKKLNTIHRNSLTADLIHQKRVCTEGPLADIEVSSIFKKESKLKVHFKSAQPVSSGKLSQSRLKIVLHKTSKSLKAGRTYSQLACKIKKLPINIDDTTLFQSLSTISKKAKANSPNFFAKDRVVQKLLNISLLASELSSSQPITSERDSKKQSSSVCLKQYMSSIDMRIISRMQDDVPVFAKTERNQQNYIREIMLLKSLSLEQLTAKVIKVQRFWKATIRKRVVNKYKSLFKYATDKCTLSQKSQISAVFAESVSSDSHHKVLLRQHVRRYEILSEDQNSDYQLQWVKKTQTNQKISNNYKLEKKLRITKQNNNVKPSHMSNQSQKDNLLVKISEENFLQWNYMSNKISKAAKGKRTLPSTSIMQELIKQSNINQRRIQEEQNSSQFCDLTNQNQQKILSLNSPNDQNRMASQKAQELENDSLQESVNWMQVESKGLSNRALEMTLKEEQKSCKAVLGQEQIGDANMDQIWIVQHLASNDVIQNYLQCGFDKFGLNLPAKKISSQNKLSQSEDFPNQDQNIDEDLSIEIEAYNSDQIFFNQINNCAQVKSNSNNICHNNIQTVVNQAIQFLLSQFSNDISNILKKSTVAAPEKPIYSVPHVVRPPCIETNFSSIKGFINKFILFIQKSESWIARIADNINKNIGPSSSQILSYLRPEEDLVGTKQSWVQDEEDQEGVFVVPAEYYQQFENQCETQRRKRGEKQLAPRIKAYLSFWHRCIFQSFNECLDYERPFGMVGRPYEWTTQPKIFRKVTRQKLQYHLFRARDRLLQIAELVCGIIFDKIDSPFAQINFSQQQRQIMNQERLSRILATELLQSQQSWINYNDESAELMVQLSRVIQEALLFQTATELKKLQRRRKMIWQSQESPLRFSAQQL